MQIRAAGFRDVSAFKGGYFEEWVAWWTSA
jgi:hypothetical protein